MTPHPDLGDTPEQEIVTVDEAAAEAGCTPRQFGARARAAGFEPLHYRRVGKALRPVYVRQQVDALINGGPTSGLQIDQVAVDLGITSDRLAEAVLKHCRGGALVLPRRYRDPR